MYVRVLQAGKEWDVGCWLVNVSGSLSVLFLSRSGGTREQGEANYHNHVSGRSTEVYDNKPCGLLPVALYNALEARRIISTKDRGSCKQDRK